MTEQTKQEVASLPTTIKVGIENAIKELHTQMPGIIVSFNSTKQTAQVQPAIKRIFRTEDENTIVTLIPANLPVLINVPVYFPRGGGYSMTFPVSAGDECLIQFCERSIDRWHQNSGVQEPGARRFHSLSDAVCTVGLSSIPNAIPNFFAEGIELKKDDGTQAIKFKSDGGIRTENSQGFMELQGSDGKLNLNGLIVDDHVHAQGNDSAGNSEQDTNGPKN